MWKSLAAAATLAFAIVSPTVVVAQQAPASQKSVPEQLVDAFNAVFGVHPGARANHAKGVILEGTFTPSASAASVSKAAHLQKQKNPIPVTVRFSDGSGSPTVPDTNEMPRGMAVKFALADGSKTDLVVLSFNGFPVATAEEFRDFLLAISASGPDAPKPTAFDKFLSSHPTAKAFVEAPKPPPVSYATLTYFGINAFKFTNAKGVATFGRYQLRPVAGEQFLTKEQVSKMGPDYLLDEIGDRVRRGPIKFKLMLQVAEQGDKIDDPSIAWPDTRKKVELGTIMITTATKESHTADKLLFLPGAVLPGIEAADPMIAARSAAYPISFVRRLKPQ
ncbi:MAG: catalase family peroxidase [Nitrospirae bacterium]|nr:MAG: catalase family peroxidase [Nitrospirota bacterium]